MEALFTHQSYSISYFWPPHTSQHLSFLLLAALLPKRIPDTHVCGFPPPFFNTHSSSGPLHQDPCFHQPAHPFCGSPLHHHSQGICSVEQRRPAKVPVSTSPSSLMVPFPTPIFNYPFGPQTDLQPTCGMLMGSNREPLSPVLLFSPAYPSWPLQSPTLQQAAPLQTSSLPLTPMLWIPHLFPSLSSSSLPQSPGKTISHFTWRFRVLRPHAPVAALPQPTSPPVYLQLASRQSAISNPLSDPGITFQPTFGAYDGRQPNNCFLVGKLVAPVQAVGLTSPAAQPPRGSIMQPGFAGLTLPASASDTTVNTQLTFGDIPGVLPVDTSTATAFGVATRMPSTGDSRSLFASPTLGPLVFLGPAAPMEGGNFGLCVSTLGPTQSQASRALNFGAGLRRHPAPLLVLLLVR
ncbi:hypothetical protein HPG69_007689 [Diceros bicornis minor]|uniref:Uncharacterized protein n=1 Tax=Diceros bicornis minor TaxID=77932 RepID=A0A7J7EAE0_DICBM|nr:hypothetical protein HPG69_007689 [Diceros bicornis minor]